jgi:hypothetical protein
MLRIRSMLAPTGGVLGSLLIAASALLCWQADAVSATDERKPQASAPAPDSKKAVARSSWKSLTPAQQRALEPLAGEWDGMDNGRQQKWLAIGNRYAKMSPAEQERMQTRMRDWIKLTPEQRRSVRQSYIGAQKLNPDQKSAQWQEYLQLSEAQKQRLAKQKAPAVPATAITRTKKKPPALLPIDPELAHETAVGPVTAATAPVPVIPAPLPIAAPAAK